MLLQPWQGSKMTGPFREERLSLSRRRMKTIRKKLREKRPETHPKLLGSSWGTEDS